MGTLCVSRPTLGLRKCTWATADSIKGDTKADGTPRTRCMATLHTRKHAGGCMIVGATAKLHDVECHILHMACSKACLPSQRDVGDRPTTTEKITEPTSDVVAKRHSGVPHTRPGISAQHRVPKIKHQRCTDNNEGSKRNQENTGRIGLLGVASQLTMQSL